MVGKRNLYFDLLKGFVILMVVAVHTSKGLGFDGIEENLRTLIRQVLNCSVPIFLACSGYFLSQKTLSGSDEIIGFYKKQIMRVYLPCMIWSIPWLILHIIRGKSLLTGIVMLFFCGFSIFYFVLLVIQLYLLLPVIQRAANKNQKGWVIVTFIISLLSVALVNYIRAINGVDLPLTVYASPFPLWMVFFVIGVLLSRGSRDYSLWWIIVGLSISLLLQVVEARYLCSFSHGVGQGIKPSSFVFSLFAILLLFSAKIEKNTNESNWIVRSLAWIGELSFVIYLSHNLVILFIRRISLYSNGPWVFRWLIVAAIDIIVIYLLRLLLPMKHRRLFGF